MELWVGCLGGWEGCQGLWDTVSHAGSCWDSWIRGCIFGGGRERWLEEGTRLGLGVTVPKKPVASMMRNSVR